MPTKKKTNRSAAKKKIISNEMLGKKPVDIETVVHHKYILLGTCSGCCHLPWRASNLVLFLSAVVLVLSGILISLLSPSNLDLQFSWGGIRSIHLNSPIASK
jgi:hypothetical protein